MPLTPLGNTGLHVTPIGFGSVKIGRNQQIKYPTPYDIPDESQAGMLLNTVLDLGINYIDTAPAYGLAEERIGRFLSHRRDEFVLSTKVGETFEDGRSIHDFAGEAVRYSIERSLRRLKTDVLDMVFVHSDGNDLKIQQQTDCVPTLLELKQRGVVQAVGFSGKTTDGATAALEWADVLMVEYHLENRSHEEVIRRAGERGIGIVIKKGLASGNLSAEEAIRFVLANGGVQSLIVGGLNPQNMRSNIGVAESVHPFRAA